MIQTIDLRNLRNGEFSQLLQDVLIITVAHDPAALKVEDTFDNLQRLSSELEAFFKLPSGIMVTKEIELLHEQRANALKGIQAIVRGHTFSDDAVIKGHALALDTHIALYDDDFTNDSYQVETNSIRNIVDDWKDQPRLKEAIEGLGLQGWQKKLETANNSFSEKYLSRASETGSGSNDSFRTKRMEACDAYYALRDELNAYYTITRASEPYKSVVASIRGLISFYNDVLARRNSSTGVPAVAEADMPDKNIG